MPFEEQVKNVDLHLVLACMMLDTYKMEFTGMQKNIRKRQGKVDVDKPVSAITMRVNRQLDRVYKDLTHIKSDIEIAVDICREDTDIEPYLTSKPMINDEKTKRGRSVD